MPITPESITSDTQAILLLTAHFSKPKTDAVKPLAPMEWGRFAAWLKVNRLTPEKIMTGELNELLREWEDKTVTSQRIEALMTRGSALALAMEKWLRAGLWVMTRSDPEYPRRFKQRLGTDSPAVLFGCGNQKLLNGGGLAVVGSRNTSESDLAFSRELGKLAASNGYSIVSGGARGVDEAAMLGALAADGTVMGVLADKLLQHCSSAKYRKYLMKNDLVLISPFYPEAGFNVGNAMQRNKYIYCLADAGLVVHSGMKGGTWTGAKENLKKDWVPLWVKETQDEEAGNKAIVAHGAAWVSSDVNTISIEGLMNGTPTESDLITTVYGTAVGDIQQMVTEARSHEPVISPVVKSKSALQAMKQLEFYDIFLLKIEQVCSDSPKTVDEIAQTLSLNTAQLKIWLNHAQQENKIQKLIKPVRYAWVKLQDESEVVQQGSLAL
jgi:predicted Rossmann fold nucleotide-binding protein DprA/Smf involved in DNA uptake